MRPLTSPLERSALDRRLKALLFPLFGLFVVVIGDRSETMRTFDARLEPYRHGLTVALLILIATGVLTVILGMIPLARTRGGHSRIVAAGVIVTVVSAGLLGIARLPNGGKLLFILAFAYAAVRILIATVRRIRRTSAAPR